MFTKKFFALMLITFMMGATLISLSACDEADTEMVETKVEGPLLLNGPVPPISDQGAAQIYEIIQNLNFVTEYEDLMRDGFASGQALVVAAKKRAAEEEGREFDPTEVPDMSDFEKFWDEHVTQEGNLLVEAKNDYYLVSFPRKTTIDIGSAKKESDKQLELLEITHELQLKVSPTGDPDAWKVEFLIGEQPFTFSTIKDGKQKDIFKLNLDEKNLSGLWHNSFQSLVQAKGILTNITLALTNPKDDEKIAFRIGRMEVNGDLQPNKQNLWSGPWGSNIENFEIDLPESFKMDFSIFKTAFSGHTKDLNPEAYEAFWPAYTALNKAMSNYDETSEKPFPKEQVTSFLTTFSQYLTTAFSENSADLKLTGIKFSMLSEDPEVPPDVFSIDEMNLGSTLSGFNKNNASVDMRYSHNNMKASFAEMPMDLPREFIPLNANFNTSFKNLPLSEIVSKLVDAVNQSQTEDEFFEKAMVELQPALIKDMSEAGTNITSNNTYIGNDIWLLLLNGSATVKDNAAYHVVGTQDIRFYGLDVLMRTLQTKAQQGIGSPEMIQQAMFGLGMLQMFGQQGEDEQNRAYRGYKFELTKTGDILLNGTNMMQMMGAMPPGMAPPAQ